MEPLLTGLREVEGVLGSFVLDGNGRLVGRDLPPLFDSDTLNRAALQLSRLRAALESDGSAFESCVARFGPHLVLLRAAQALTLCVLLPRGTNLAAVQMSATLIARRLPMPGTAVRSFAAAETPTAQSDSMEASRFFRGRRV
jgi:predicted regulator of Ras-like GTPase activity (Roadblock/LC7/MglB family)